MRYLALACDYDGTLATDSHVNVATLEALQRLRASERKLILLTGREFNDLTAVFPNLHFFDRVIVENGAVLYRPAHQQETLLAEAPSEVLLTELHRRGVTPISVGRSIVATREPHEATVHEVIRDLGVKLRVILNKGAVMILPGEIDKGTGLAVALAELALSAESVAGIGDAENDVAFLQRCGCAAAVANALPAIKMSADVVTPSDNGRGVTELVNAIIGDHLERYATTSDM